MKTFRTVLGELSVALLLFSRSVLSDFLASPEIRWTYDLPSSSSSGSSSSSENRVSQGNAVTVSPDGSRLYVTESNGRLHIVQTSDLSRSAIYSPSESSSTSSGVLTTNCTSGVALHSDFAAYVVVDAETGSSGEITYNSRIIAVDHNANALWTVTVSGKVEGTPYISGNRIYIVRNTVNGYVSVIEFDSDSNQAEVIATIPDPAGTTRLGLLGPLAAHSVSIDSKERDVLVFALAPDETTGGANANANANANAKGGLYAVYPSSDYDKLDGRGTDAYELSLVSSYALPTKLRPAFDGSSIYLAHESRLTGWDGSQSISEILDGSSQDLVPNWETRRSNGNDDQTIYYPTAPVLAADSSFLIVSTNTPGVSCYDTQAAGKTSWSDGTDSINVAEPIIANVTDNPTVVVYVIQEQSGSVRQYDASDGSLLWEFSCSAVTGDNKCDLSVEAEFSMASSGNALYYAFTNGTVVALSVGDFPTEAPTSFPTSAPSNAPVSHGSGSTPSRPTSAPSLRGSASNSTSEPSDSGGEGSSNSTSAAQTTSGSALSLPIILGAAAGGLVLLIALVFCCMFMKRKRISKVERERTQQELEAVRKWNQERQAYEKECREQEQQTLKEIVKNPNLPPPPPPTTPSPKPQKGHSNSSSGQKGTPLTLDSITEDADYDDGSEAGVEISLSDRSEEPTITLTDGTEIQTSNSISKPAEPVGLLGPVDPKQEDDQTEDPADNASVNPIVKNLSESFTAMARPTVGDAATTVKQPIENAVRGKPRDPEPTGAIAAVDYERSVQAELVQAMRESRKAKSSDSTIFSNGSTDAGSMPILYRLDDDIVPVTKLSKPATPSDAYIDPRGRPTSPDFSDIWSVDESLYIDDESKTGRGKSVMAAGTAPDAPPVQNGDENPDDEPGIIAKGARPKSPPMIRAVPPHAMKPAGPVIKPYSLELQPAVALPSPQSTGVTRLDTRPAIGVEQARSMPSLAPAIPNNQPANKQLSRSVPSIPSSSTSEVKLTDGGQGDVPSSQVHSRVSPQVRGGSARPKAGLFTRLDNPLAAPLGNTKSGDTCILEDREARAVYAPSPTDVDEPAAIESGYRSTGSSMASSRQTTRASNQTIVSSKAQDVSSSYRASNHKVRRATAETRPRSSRATTKPEPKTAADSSSKKSKTSSPWDSFLTELAKVEDTFFNPKLGNSKSTRAKKGKQRAKPSSRPRSLRKDVEYSEDSDSDSDSSESAGLNPVDGMT